MADNAPNPESSKFTWDFFLAHAGPDLAIARNLKRALEPPAKTFLDDENLMLGDDFDLELATAQQSSLISVVIVSPNTEQAYYQREEIAAAIQMSRADPHTHRVVPVFFNPEQMGGQIPYGLRLKHSLRVSDSNDLTEAGKRLLQTWTLMKQYEVKKADVVAEQLAAIPKITGGNVNALSGIVEVTRFVRPLLKTLLILFVLVVIFLIASLLLPTFADVRALLATVLGSLCALLLASMLWLTARSFNYAQQIAQGRINGG